MDEDDKYTNVNLHIKRVDYINSVMLGWLAS